MNVWFHFVRVFFPLVDNGLAEDLMSAFYGIPVFPHFSPGFLTFMWAAEDDVV